MVHENLVAALDRFQTAVYLKDKAGRYLSMNKTGLNYMSGAHGSILGKTAHDLFDVEGATAMTKSDEYLMSTHQLFTHSLQTQDRLSGKTMSMYSVKTALHTPSGKPLGVVGISLMNCEDAALFSEACRILPQFVKRKQPHLVTELLELRTVSQFLRVHQLH